MTIPRLRECIELEDARDFENCLVSAIKALPPGALPLQACCDQGGLADDREISVSLLDMQHGRERIVARVGVFFAEVVGGCNCHDDPLEANRYCVLEVVIARPHGDAEFTPLET